MITEQSTPDQIASMRAAVDLWNQDHPEGTSVRYWPGVHEGPGVESKTRSAAWVMPSGSAVVLVDGYAGGIALTHVTPEATR